MALKDLVVCIHSGQPYDVYVGRGSIWGNPATHLPLTQTQASVQVATREDAISYYEDWLPSQPHLMALMPTLRGKRLGCHCEKSLPCHAMVLVLLANPPS